MSKNQEFFETLEKRDIFESKKFMNVIIVSSLSLEAILLIDDKEFLLYYLLKEELKSTIKIFDDKMRIFL